MVGYLTPSTLPADTLCRVLFIPNDLDWLAQVTGALQVLTFPESWTFFGAVTPQQAADAMLIMFDQFCFNQGVCRVIGEVIAFAGSISPDVRWLLCDGASVSRATYPDLFTAIGVTYGAVDAAHFNLPDLRGRTPAAAGSGPGLSARTLGQSIGEETHTLTNGESAAHSHNDVGHTHVAATTVPSVLSITAGVPVPIVGAGPGITGIGNASIDSSGGGSAHNNMQPTLFINYFIVALQ